MVGLISRGGGDGVEQLAVWCMGNSLLLNTSTTKELIIDVRKNKADCVEKVANFCFV